MKNIKTFVSKTWVLVAATALITGSSGLMAFSLSRNIKPTLSAAVATPIPYATGSYQSPLNKTLAAAEYDLIEYSKFSLTEKQKIKEQISKLNGFTGDELTKMYDDTLERFTPKAADMPSVQAAALASEVAKKIFGLTGFKGYTAKVFYIPAELPASTTWLVNFIPPAGSSNKESFDKSWSIKLDSVTGTVFYACGSRHSSTAESNSLLKDSFSQEKAAQVIALLLPPSVAIKESQVIKPPSQTGLTVLYELSDGSAYSYSIDVINQNPKKLTELETYTFFPTGYDGSLD
jgi:hypothetical protein